MGKSIHFLALVCAMASTQALALTGDNPFEKVKRIHAGAGSDWRVVDDVLRKSSGNEGGTWYHLEVGQDSMSLIMTDSAEVGAARSFKTLAIEDMKLDGRQMPVFKWCLQNQPEHNRFLQQGLSVKMGICQNLGEQGEFRVKVNNQTMQSLETGKRLSFTIKPYRTAIEVNFDIENIDDALAVLDMQSASEQVAAAPAPVVAVPLAKPPAKTVVKQVVKMCDAKAPSSYKKIKPVEYVCSDAADKASAEKKIAAAVAIERDRRAQIAKKREQERLAALEAKRQQEEELLKRQQEEKAAEAAILDSQMKHLAVLDDLTKKMLGVCNKMWGQGKHRCYCEKYIQHAPAGIQSNPACN